MKKKIKSKSQNNIALIIIDCINDLNFPGGEKVLPWAERLANKLVAFKRNARAAGIPVIYVNDNFKRWQDDFLQIYDHCTRKNVLGREFTKKLKPSKKDYFILKPRHSALYASSLEPLLEDMGIKHLILCGIATNLCVLFTAHDAHMRGYKLTVLSDCCAAETDFDHNVALEQLKKFCHADITLSNEFKFR